MTKTLEDRLIPNLAQMPDGCIEWTGWRCLRGYGQIRTGGADAPKIKTHRAAWIINNGPIPEGMMVLHHCDNPPCCNPEHLYIGDAFDNMADKKRRGRIGDTGKGKRKVDAAGIRADFVRNYERRYHAHGGWIWRSNAIELAVKYKTAPEYVLSIASGRARRSIHEFMP